MNNNSKMEGKSKFQQLWAQFGTSLMEEPMRDHEKRVEELVRENERLRLEISNSKAEATKELQESKHLVEELSEENAILRQEVTDEVRSGVERVQERNMALAQAKRENAGLKQAISSIDEGFSQERTKFKRQIKLLRNQLQWEMYSHSQLRKDVGILRGEDGSEDISQDEDDDYNSDDDQDEESLAASQAERQLQTERSLQSSALRHSTRRLLVEETPELGEEFGGPEQGEDEEEEEEDDGVERELPITDDESEKSGVEDEEPVSERTLRRSTRNQNPENQASETGSVVNANTRTLRSEKIQLTGTKRGRDESSDRTTNDGVSQIPDRQTEYASTADMNDSVDSPDRPAKRTRRQTERYTSALETTKKLAKIMTPPASSPTYLPTVLPRRSVNRSPARKSLSLSQAKAQTPSAKSTVSTPKSRRITRPKSPATAPPKTTGNKSPKAVAKSPKAPKKAMAMPNVLVNFTLVSGNKIGKTVVCDNPEASELLASAIKRSSEKIRSVAGTPAFWRSYALKRASDKAERGEPLHCAYTSQFSLKRKDAKNKDVELENPWKQGEDFACVNCTKEGIACFTVSKKLNAEKYEATYRPPKGKP